MTPSRHRLIPQFSSQLIFYLPESYNNNYATIKKQYAKVTKWAFVAHTLYHGPIAEVTVQIVDVFGNGKVKHIETKFDQKHMA